MTDIDKIRAKLGMAPRSTDARPTEWARAFIGKGRRCGQASAMRAALAGVRHPYQRSMGLTWHVGVDVGHMRDRTVYHGRVAPEGSRCGGGGWVHVLGGAYLCPGCPGCKPDGERRFARAHRFVIDELAMAKSKPADPWAKIDAGVRALEGLIG